jgi:putative exosortase-associated protein (TIGR04073 family)
VKTLLAMMLVLAVVWTACPAAAEEPSAAADTQEAPPVVVRIGAKFARGVANFVTGWVEFPKQIYLVGRNEGWLRGSTKGPVDGLGMFGARTIAGAYEVLTFPLPIPPAYQPMLKPEYVWQSDPYGSPAAPAGPPSDKPAK